MIISNCRFAPKNDLNRWTWNSLAVFQNVAITAKKIRTLHEIPQKQERNAKKQAEQIRYCLIQAREYFTAARAVTMATRPLLIYYGILSLSLAEILLKQTGLSSLDGARGQHAHHGLDLRSAAHPSTTYELADSASAIRAVPMITAKGRIGTFELWHQSARESALGGPGVVKFQNFSQQDRCDLVFQAADTRLPLIPGTGISFLDCLRAHPGCSTIISRNGILPSWVRVRAHRHQDEPSNTTTFSLDIQESDSKTLEQCYNLIAFEPDAVNRLNITEFQSGSGLRWQISPTLGGLRCIFPPAIQIVLKDAFIQTEVHSLNEFGIIYIGMFILGNYARYYPERWMHDVETSSPLSLAAMEFTDIAEERAPLLGLSELDRIHYLLE